MKRISFDIQYRPQIESGEYRVVTDMGEPVEIVKWNCRGRCPILAVIDGGDTDDSCFYKADGVSLNGVDSLFILIDEPDPNEFEKALADILMYREYEGSTETEEDIEKGMIPFITAAKQHAPRLLEIARKECVKSAVSDDLTWEDMLIIHKHIKDAMNKFLYAFQTPGGQQKVYEDVLRRFIESKGNKTMGFLVANGCCGNIELEGAKFFGPDNLDDAVTFKNAHQEGDDFMHVYTIIEDKDD